MKAIAGGVRIGIACLIALTAIGWWTNTQALTLSFEVEIAEVSSLTPVNGRVHVNIAIEMLGDPRRERVIVTNAIVHDEGVSIVLAGEEKNADDSDLNPPWEQGLSVTLDNLPAGEYPLRLVFEDLSDGSLLTLASVIITVPQERRAELPLAVSIWPPDPTVLDDVWLIVEPVSFCSTLEGGLLIIDAVIDEEPVAFHEIHVLEWANDCPEPGDQPMLKALPLPVPGKGGTTNLVYVFDGMSAQTGSIRLLIDEEITSRMAGSWYNPDQSGHGITLEVLNNGGLLLYWFTFDDEGNPAWIIAQGEIDGSGGVLAASLVSGGQFPPNFDAGNIEMQDWGTISLSFSACNSGHMQWQTEAAGFSDGQLSLTRLSAPAGQPCQGPPPDSALVPEWYQGPGTFFTLPDMDD